MVAFRAPSGRMALQPLPKNPNAPLQVAQRLRFAEAAIRARGTPFGQDLPPAAYTVAALARGPVPLNAPSTDRRTANQLRYRSWLGDSLPDVEAMVLGSPAVKTRREEMVATRVARRRGSAPLMAPARAVAFPRLPPSPPPPRPRPL